jgi:hypothetical protein
MVIADTYGPFLAPSATLWIFAGPALVTWYLRFSQQLLNGLLGALNGTLVTFKALFISRTFSKLHAW